MRRYEIFDVGCWALLVLAPLAPRVGSGQSPPGASRESEVAAPARPLPVGKSRFAFDLDGVSLEVFTHKPARYRGERMIIVLHGVLRNADEYRDHASLCSWGRPTTNPIAIWTSAKRL
jgi:hypothetical protein